MKTTIDLPDALAREAKSLARSQHVSLRELVVDGLRKEVERRSRKTEEADFHFTTADGDGLHPDIDPASVIDVSYGVHR